jgi:hypothetical protein
MGMTIKSTIFTSMLAIALGLVNPATAADYSFTLPAGWACSGFDLTVNIDVSDHQVYKEWTDENGYPVRIISAGKGNALQFVNETTGATFSLKANGSVSHTTINPDGTSTVSSEGHNVIILFPTDEPPGPTTTLYLGRITYTVIDATQHFTLQDVSGNSTDICAALSE